MLRLNYISILFCPRSLDPPTVIDTFFSHWVIGLNGDGFGIPSNYVYTSSGRKLDTKEGGNYVKSWS